MDHNFPTYDDRHHLTGHYPAGATMERILSHELRIMESASSSQPADHSDESSGPDAS
jgi:hypothetical protein